MAAAEWLLSVKQSYRPQAHAGCHPFGLLLVAGACCVDMVGSVTCGWYMLTCVPLVCTVSTTDVRSVDMVGVVLRVWHGTGASGRTNGVCTDARSIGGSAVLPGATLWLACLFFWALGHWGWCQQHRLPRDKPYQKARIRNQKWRNIWIRDVFCYRVPAPLVLEAKHVSNPA